MKWILMAALATAGAAPLAAPLAAQMAAPAGATGAPPATYHGRLRQLDVSAPKLALDIKVDGHLNEADWAQAALLTGFSQYSPVDRLPAEDSTEVLVMYTDHAIYFGIRAYEPHGAPQARHSDRDRIGGDDHVVLILDTFNDRRRAMIFGINPFGIQNDGMLNDGSGIDLSPDFIYESKGRVTDYGYEIEVRIPFKSMRYQDIPVQQWGFNVLRLVQHSGQEQTWAPMERSAPSFLAQGGRFTDMTELKRGLVLDVNPVMTARSLGARPVGSDAWRYENENPEFGGNVRWGITPNLTANATVKPDFSQVESDVGQVVTDPRQALFFPEKRPFFLEGNEYFQVPNNLIYTRRVGAPEGAAKLNGKIGDLNVGILSAVDDNGTSGDHPIFNILRMRRDLGAQSSVGMVYTDRMHGDDYNRVAGVDTRIVFGGNRYIFAGQLATSFTGIDGNALHGKPLFDVGINRTGREFGWSASVSGKHPEFITQSGFISRTGVANARVQPRWTWFPSNSILQTISFAPHIDATWEWDRFTKGTFPNDFKLNSSTNAVFKGGWRATLYHWSESFMYPAYLYTNYFIEQRNAAGVVVDTVPYTGTHRLTNIGVMTALNTPQWKKFSASVELIGGQDDNFDEWSSAWILYSTVNLNWQPTERVRVNGRWLEQRVHRKSDGSLVSATMVPRVKMEYQINRPMFFRFVGQYTSQQKDALRDDSRTNAPILIRRADGSFRPAPATERGSFRADWLFSYQPNPGTVLFVGYGSSMAGTDYFAPADLERTSDGFFVKLSYLWRAP